MRIDQGDADDFKEGYKVVAAALADNDMVSMFHTPNVAASLDDYVAFHPEDESTVDIIGCVVTGRLCRVASR